MSSGVFDEKHGLSAKEYPAAFCPVCGYFLAATKINGLVTIGEGKELRRVCKGCQFESREVPYKEEKRVAQLCPWQPSESIDDGFFICIFPKEGKWGGLSYLAPTRIDGMDEIGKALALHQVMSTYGVADCFNAVAIDCIPKASCEPCRPCPLCYQGVPGRRRVPGMRKVCHACCLRHNVIEWQSTKAVKDRLYIMNDEKGLHPGYISKPAIVVSQSPDRRILDLSVLQEEEAIPHEDADEYFSCRSTCSEDEEGP
jgi:hypothetical protein